MNQWKPVMLLARKSLLWVAVVVCLCVAVVLGLGQWANTMKATVAQLQAGVLEQQSLYASRQGEVTQVRQNIGRFETLRSQGLVGSPDRALWVEQLQNVYSQAQLPSALTVQLLAPKPLGASNPAAAPTDAPPGAPLVHDLQFEMRNVVESDVLTVLRGYRAQASGRFRVNACKMLDAKESGLIAQCVLRFITLPLPLPLPPAPAPDQTPVAP